MGRENKFCSLVLRDIRNGIVIFEKLSYMENRRERSRGRREIWTRQRHCHAEISTKINQFFRTSVAQKQIKPFAFAVVILISIADLDSLKVVYETVTSFSTRNICCRTRKRTSMPLVVCFECFLRGARCCCDAERDWTRGTGATGCLRFTTIVV